tara:strand:- start:102 stop:803 length:702 start_codon:yes stop_codon:yes gene_type:complete
MDKYYISVDNEWKGPYALSQLRKMWDSGTITMDTQYTTDSMDGWAEISEVLDNKEENPLRAATPEASAPPPKQSTEPESSKPVSDREEVFFHADNIEVTRSLFKTPTSQIAIRNITSVKLKNEYRFPHLLGAFAYIIFGLFWLNLAHTGTVHRESQLKEEVYPITVEDYTVFYLMVIVVLGGGYVVMKKCLNNMTMQALYLETASGSVKAITENDTSHFNGIVTSLKQAIAKH